MLADLPRTVTQKASLSNDPALALQLDYPAIQTLASRTGPVQTILLTLPLFDLNFERRKEGEGGR